MANIYASYAAPAVDASGTKHLVWEDNGRLYHARYDSRAGTWVDKNSISNAQGGSNIKLLAGNIIPVDNSGKLYAPGLIATWVQNIGNASEIYAVVGKYTSEGKLEWSDAVQVTDDDVANQGFDLTIGQNGLMQIVTQKVLLLGDPRKSDYQTNPEQLAEDLNSPNQGDKDLYHAPLLIERDNQENLKLTLNPNTQTTNSIGIQKEGEDLTFRSEVNIASPNTGASINPFLLINNQQSPTPANSLENNQFQSARLLSASPQRLMTNTTNTNSPTSQSSVGGNASFPTSGSPFYGFELNIGTTQNSFEGTSLPLPELPKSLQSAFGANLGLSLSGGIGTSQSRDWSSGNDSYSVNANLALGLSISSSKSRGGYGYRKDYSKPFPKETVILPEAPFIETVDVPWVPQAKDTGYNVGVSLKDTLSFSLGFKGSQTSDQNGQLKSIKHGINFGIGLARQISFNVPTIPIKGINGALAQLQLTGKLAIGLNYEYAYSNPKPNAVAPFQLKPNDNLVDYYLISGVAGGVSSLVSAATWLAFNNSETSRGEGIAGGIGSLIFQGIAAAPIIMAGSPLIWPTTRDDFNTITKGVGISASVGFTGKGGILLNTLSAEASGSIASNLNFVFEPTTKITLAFPFALDLKAKAGPLTFGWGWSENVNIVLRDDSLSQQVSQVSTENAQIETLATTEQNREEQEPVSKLVQLKATYSPYRGTNAIHQNSRFSPIDNTQNIQPRLLTANPLLASSSHYRIGSIALNEGGRNYLEGESGSFLVIPSEGTAILIAYVEKGVIQQIVVENPGSGYDVDNPPSLDFSQYGSGGSGASATVNLIDQQINNLVNDGVPFLDSIDYFVGGSQQTSTALAWIADGADSTKPISNNSEQLTTRVRVATLSGNFWTIAPEIPDMGSKGMNYDPVISWYLNENNQPTLMAVWAHANVDGIGKDSVEDLIGTLDKIVKTDIYYARLNSFANEWSTPQKLATLEGTDNRLDIKRTEDGRLHLAWINTVLGENQVNQQSIYSVFFEPQTAQWDQVRTIDPIKEGSVTNSSIASLKVGELEGQPALYWSNTADTPYYFSVLQDEPELYYRLEAYSDEMLEVNYGKLSNSITNQAFYDGNMTFGQTGALTQDPDPSVQFNGQGAFVIGVPDTESVALGDFSVETWVKFTDQTLAGQGIITRGQPNGIQETLPSATLTYKITQGQDQEGKWFYFITPEGVNLSNDGDNIFPNTLRITNFQVNEKLDLSSAVAPKKEFTLRAYPDEFFSFDDIFTGEDYFQIKDEPQNVVFGEDTIIRRRFEIGPGQFESELIELEVGQRLKIGSQTYTITSGETFSVSLKAGDNISIFDNNNFGNISQSLDSTFDFNPDNSGSLSGVRVNNQQIISSGSGLDYRPFLDPRESFTLTADLEFDLLDDWYLLTGENQTLVFNSGAGEISSESLEKDQWHHVVATYNNATKESILYVNGEAIAQTTGQRFNPSDNAILVGYNFNGFLDEVAIYNKPLTIIDENAVQFDSSGKYAIAFDPNAPTGEITNHFNAQNVDPDSAEEATYYSVWNGNTWGTPQQFISELKLNPTQVTIERKPAVDIVSVSGLQPDGLSDQHLRITLAQPNKNLFGRTITKVEIERIDSNLNWSIDQNQKDTFGSNLVAVMLGGKKLNDLRTGQFKHTVLGIDEVLDLYFYDQNYSSDSKYNVTLTLNNGEIISIEQLAPSPNLEGTVNTSPIVKGEILEKEVTALSEVDSGVIIDIETAGAGQSLVAGKIRNGEIGFAIGHPYQFDENISKKGLVWVLKAGSNKELNELTGIPLKNDDIPEDGNLIVGQNGDQIGYAMAVGDIDGDGVDDLMISAPDAEGKNGKIYVISGKSLGDGKFIDLAQLPFNAVVTILGTRFSNAGFSLASGDVDGDDIFDIVIGAPNALSEIDKGNPVGAVHLVYGKSDFFSGNPTINLGIDTLIFEGANGTAEGSFTLIPNPEDQWHSQVGYSVAVVHSENTANNKALSFNGDGIGDILIGAPGYYQTIRFDVEGNPLGVSEEQLEQYRSLINHVPNQGIGYVQPQKDINTGRAYLVFGNSDRNQIKGLDQDTLNSKGIIFDGSPFEEGAMALGQKVTSAGDMNGDGFVDIAMGAPEAAGRAGMVFLFGGRGGDQTTSFRDSYEVMKDSDVVFIGGDVFNYAGQSLAGVGDVNNDKIDDLLIGVPQAGEARGQNYLIFGVEHFAIGQDALPTAISLKSGIPDNSFVLNGGKPQGLAGHAVAKGFDLNGDETGDMLLSAPYGNQVYVAFGHPWLKKEGSVRLDNLANDQGLIINRYEGSEPKYKFDGKFVSHLGDINGDGYGDMAVAGNGESTLIQFGGATWDLLDAGFGSGQLPIFLKKDEITDITLESVQGIGDINNDGFNDFIVYNSRSQTQNVHDYTIVYGGEYLNNLDSLSIDVAVALDEERRNRPILSLPGFVVGQVENREIYKQSLKLGEAIYAPVLTFSEQFVYNSNEFSIQSHLKLEENGELKYYDHQGRVLWTGGKANVGIVKMEIGLLDGKYRLLFKDKDDNIVSSSSEFLNYVEGKIPYLRVGHDFITLSQRDNDNIRRNYDPSDWTNDQRQDVVIYSWRDKFEYIDDIYNSTSTVWGNALPSLIGGENFTTPDGERSFGVMPVSYYSKGSPYGYDEPSIIGILERSNNPFYHLDSIWAPAPTPIEFQNPTNVYLRFKDNGELVVDFSDDEKTIIWSSNTIGDDLFLNLNRSLSKVNIAQSTSEVGNSSGAIGYKNLYGSKLDDNFSKFTSAGDLDNDGYMDLITFDAEKIYLHFGSISDGISSNEREFNAPGFGITAGVGDITGSGNDTLFTLSQEGTFISYGFKRESPVINQKVNIIGYSNNVDYFDNAVSIFAVGDVNGDNFADFIVRDSHIVANQTRAAFRLVYGNGSGDNFKSTQVQTYLPVYYPLPISGSGDVNGDGYDDIIFSDPSYLDNDNGRVYILFGGADLSNKTVITPDEINSLSGNDGFFIDGLPQSRAGESVSGGEDINGDGLSDFMIGAPGVDGSVGLTYALFGGDFTKSIHQAGTQGNDILEGTGTGDRMIGLLGDDILIGNGGKDVLYGGAGDDELIIADPYFSRVDGGSGFNTLTLEGYKDQNWDLTTLSPGLRVQNISAVDLTHFGKNTLTLNKTTVIKITDIQNNLVIFGDAEDEIILSEGFERGESFNFGGTLFDRYQDGTANVFVAPSIKTEVKFTANPENSPMSMPSTTDGVLESESGVLSETSPSNITNIADVSNGQPTQFYVSATPTRKDAGVFTFTVNRSGDLTTSVTALYQTINDTAIAGRDYVAQIGTLVFAPGEIVKTVEIELIDHDIYGGNNRSFGLAIQPVDDAFGRFYGSNYLQLQTEENVQIRNLDKGSLSQATAIELNTGLPLGAMNFNVTAPEDKVIVTIPFSGVVDMNSYLRFNPASDTYEEFLYNGNTGVEFVDLNNNGRTDTIKIHLMDGGRGDSDGVVNGIITGSNAPGLKTPGPMEVNPGVFYIPTNSDGALQLHSITVPENYQFGVVEVDDSLGTINSLKPTDSGYTEVALTRGEVIFDNDFGSNINALSSDTAKLAFNNPELLKNSEFEANGSFSQIELQGGKFYSFYLTENDTTEMSINNDNLIITPEGRGYHDIKWSSLNLEVGTDLLLTPGNTGEKVEAQIQIARAGSYNNTIALFKVDTLTGDLDIDGDGVMDLQPGGEGYVSEVFKRVQDPLTGVILPEMETIFTSKDISVNLDGGQMYGLALITNGKINQFLTQNPSNEIEAHVHSFFSFEKANPDGISHIRRLGENLWGFEDLIGGGDRDFNDMIVQVNF
ncbi:FG-GAP repeat protein [Cyanobacterium aponinum FACHB-4101]|uniref:LamG-like jellyroll fold domain-containing protein n=1 Tax=Cyanobacterium aponinum TaxID=379064 RepID=UPI001681526D|nr:LamG-like jellyroll fold domain-containing protein [Cyanobacterium aponinum]MBD2394531.1 FG-GAP repeat protein [Cyanobacterium aponinum FACHB-4101]